MNTVTVYQVNYARKTRVPIGKVKERRRKERGDNLIGLLRLARKAYASSPEEALYIAVDGKEARQAQEDTLGALASSLDLRERETGLHSRRVREYTLILARSMGVRGETALLNMGLGALLHDMGKIGVSDNVLLKPAGLSEEEVQEMRRHPELGASLISAIRFLDGAREIVRYHHERFDGTGYPGGLSGKEIPPGARIFAVVDVFDALTSDRPYRASVPYREAADVIAGERGKHFDPEVVDAFLSIPFREWAEAAARNGVILREA